MSYTYVQNNIQVPGFGNVNLEYIRTAASNVVLRETNSTVPASGFFGINAGFFDGSNLNLLSIAVNNNRPVSGQPNEVGVGWSNAIRRGTVRWDGDTGSIGVPVAGNAGEIAVVNRNFYWAQGGLSMKLGIEGQMAWEDAIIDEGPGGIGWQGNSQRSGLVYTLSGPLGNRTGTAFLVITRTPCTLWNFRQAIKIAIPNARDGVFLDGGGSTQINCREAQFAGDGRTIPQIVSLRNT